MTRDSQVDRQPPRARQHTARASPSARKTRKKGDSKGRFAARGRSVKAGGARESLAHSRPFLPAPRLARHLLLGRLLLPLGGEHLSPVPQRGRHLKRKAGGERTEDRDRRGERHASNRNQGQSPQRRAQQSRGPRPSRASPPSRARLAAGKPAGVHGFEALLGPLLLLVPDRGHSFGMMPEEGELRRRWRWKRRRRRRKASR